MTEKNGVFIGDICIGWRNIRRQYGRLGMVGDEKKSKKDGLMRWMELSRQWQRIGGKRDCPWCFSFRKVILIVVFVVGWACNGLVVNRVE